LVAAHGAVSSLPGSTAGEIWRGLASDIGLHAVRWIAGHLHDIGWVGRHMPTSPAVKISLSMLLRRVAAQNEFCRRLIFRAHREFLCSRRSRWYGSQACHLMFHGSAGRVFPSVLIENVAD
jgi:hypothetical protein